MFAQKQALDVLIPEPAPAFEIDMTPAWTAPSSEMWQKYMTDEEDALWEIITEDEKKAYLRGYDRGEALASKKATPESEKEEDKFLEDALDRGCRLFYYQWGMELGLAAGVKAATLITLF